jgi:hypothetical protein
MQEEQVVQGCPVIQKKEKKKEKLIGHLILAMRDYSSAISTDSKKKKKHDGRWKEISTCRHFLQDNAGLVALHARAEQLKSSRIRVEQVDRDEMPDKRKIKRNRHLTSLSSFF